MLQTFRIYYTLTKPGIVRSNVLMAAAGFLLAVGQLQMPFDQNHGSQLAVRFIGLAVGLGLVIASACVSNNYLDRRIDSLMGRTKQRALPAGHISGAHALSYAGALGVIGILVLAYMTNWWAAGVSAVAFVAYVVLYGWAKRHTVYGTLVGTISGSLPPVIGYVAVTGQFDLACALLYIILTAWQLPHFYAIAIYRAADYKAASIPVLPLVKGIAPAKRHIMGWIVVLAATAPLLSVFGYTGWLYGAAACLISLWWLYSGWRGYQEPDVTWAKAMFLRSLVVNIVLCGGFAVGGFLV